MKKYILLIVSSVLVFGSYAQPLQRKANWGFQFHMSNDTINAEKNRAGFLIDSVMPNSTASKAGLIKGDMIISVNNVKTQDKEDYRNVDKLYRCGDKVTFTVLRGERSLKLKGEIIGKSKEQYDQADVLYESVPFQNGALRSIIIKPKGEKKVPLVFFIQGYTCSSIDNMMSEHPYQRILEGLVNRGYGICKVEKPGMGDCQGTEDCDEIDFLTELSAFQAAYDNLANYDFIDKNNIFIFGHSMGGVIAPSLNQSKVKANGIMVYGTVLNSWFEYFVEMNRRQFIFLGEDYVKNDLDFNRRLPFLYEFMVLKKTPMELAKDSTMERILKEDWHWDGGNKIESRSYKYWQQLQEPGQVKAWKNTDSNVLAIWGAGDFVAFSEEEHKTIIDIVNHYHKGKGTYYRLPNCDHAFSKVEDQYDSAKKWGNWEYMKANFNSDIIDKLDSWMKEKMED